MQCKQKENMNNKKKELNKSKKIYKLICKNFWQAKNQLPNIFNKEVKNQMLKN